MGKLLIFTMALMFTADCASEPSPQARNVNESQRVATTESPTPTPKKDGKETAKESGRMKEVPPEFSNVDFKNFSYPISLNLELTVNFRRRSIPLKDGSFEYRDPKGIGGATYDFRAVDYVDLTGDGKSEAVVRVSQVICGGSCDGGSDFFYFYAIDKGRVRLLSRLETGSAGYDCGLKSFIVKKQLLNLETFRACRFNGIEFKPAHDDPTQTGGKFLTNRFTRFVLRFNGNRFVLTKREVFPYPEDDLRSFRPNIEISND